MSAFHGLSGVPLQPLPAAEAMQDRRRGNRDDARRPPPEGGPAPEGSGQEPESPNPATGAGLRSADPDGPPTPGTRLDIRV